MESNLSTLSYTGFITAESIIYNSTTISHKCTHLSTVNAYYEIPVLHGLHLDTLYVSIEYAPRLIYFTFT